LIPGGRKARLPRCRAFRTTWEVLVAYVYPTCVAVVRYQGGRIRISPDQQWSDDDPFVKARPDLFSVDPATVARSGPVEQTTRAPGEKRTVRRAKPKASGSS